MDKKIFNIVFGAALVASFFLAFYSFFGASITGLDMVTAKGGDWQKYLILLIPICGLLLLLGEFNNDNTVLPRSIVTWLPFLTVLDIIIVKPLIDGAAFGDIFKAIGKGYGIGMWIAIVASIVVAFYRPKAR